MPASGDGRRVVTTVLTPVELLPRLPLPLPIAFGSTNRPAPGVQVLQSMKRPTVYSPPPPSDGLAMPRVACVQPPVPRQPAEQPLLLMRQLLTDVDPVPYLKKLDDALGKWEDWKAENAIAGPESYVVEERRGEEELAAEEELSERILRYRAEVQARSALPVSEYHRGLKRAEDQAAADQALEEARAASEAANAIKDYVAWPPKVGPYDHTPKRPVPGEA